MKFIYLIESENKYKIGVSKNLNKRIKQLQIGSGNEIKLINRVVEKTLHREFKTKNTIGEWFELTPDDIESFDEICNTIENNIKILKNAGNKFV